MTRPPCSGNPASNIIAVKSVSVIDRVTLKKGMKERNAQWSKLQVAWLTGLVQPWSCLHGSALACFCLCFGFKQKEKNVMWWNSGSKSNAWKPSATSRPQPHWTVQLDVKDMEDHLQKHLQEDNACSEDKHAQQIKSLAWSVESQTIPAITGMIASKHQSLSALACQTAEKRRGEL